MAKKEDKYYSLKKILKENATYNMIIGERSNGKTFSVLDYALLDFVKSGYTNQLGIIRRWSDDFKGARGHQMFEGIVKCDKVREYTKGEWEYIVYKSSKWYLAKNDPKLDRDILMGKPFAFGFSLNAVEHDKSISFPDIKTVLFDEFLTRKTYLPDEFVLLMNTISTIVRDRDDVKIFMCANTVNKYAPYFTEMGIKHIDKMKQGTIDVYTYGNSELKVAVEYCSPNKEGKKSDKYFAFDNPQLNMITGGSWEIAMYPHLPQKYKNGDIKYMYFIEFNRTLLQCEVIKVRIENKNHVFTYIHKKTTPLKLRKRDRVFTTEYSSHPNYRRNIKKPQDDLDKYFLLFYKEDRVFYQDNEIGEVVRNYLNWCSA